MKSISLPTKMSSSLDSLQLTTARSESKTNSFSFASPRNHSKPSGEIKKPWTTASPKRVPTCTTPRELFGTFPTPCNGCAIVKQNPESHNLNNCGRKTHPEFNHEEHTLYAQSTVRRAATAWRLLAGKFTLLTIDKTFGTTPNNATAAGQSFWGGRRGRGRDITER